MVASHSSLPHSSGTILHRRRSSSSTSTSSVIRTTHNYTPRQASSTTTMTTTTGNAAAAAAAGIIATTDGVSSSTTSFLPYSISTSPRTTTTTTTTKDEIIGAVTTTTVSHPHHHHQRRRWQNWMKQQWRERGKTNNTPKKKTKKNSILEEQYHYSTTTSKKSILSSNHNDEHSSAAAATAVRVSNIDEALGVLRCNYQYQNGVFQVVNQRETFEGMSSSSTMTTTTTTTKFDWLLDGYPEWQYQYDKTRRLMEELYPNHTKNNNNDQPQQQQQQNPFLFTEEEENYMLQCAGSALGQQEYQFASFPTMTEEEEEQQQQQQGAANEETFTHNKEPKVVLDNENNDHGDKTTKSKSSLLAAHQQHTTALEQTTSLDLGKNSNSLHDTTTIPSIIKTKKEVETIIEEHNQHATDVDPIDAFLKEKMATKAALYRFNDDDDNHVSPTIAHTFENPKHNDGDDNHDDDDDDFGDFQQADDMKECDEKSQPPTSSESTQPTLHTNTSTGHDDEHDVPEKVQEETASYITQEDADSITTTPQGAANTKTPSNSPLKSKLAKTADTKTPAIMSPSESNQESSSAFYLCHSNVFYAQPPTPVTRNGHPSPTITVDEVAAKAVAAIIDVESPMFPLTRRFQFQDKHDDDNRQKDNSNHDNNNDVGGDGNGSTSLKDDMEEDEEESDTRGAESSLSTGNSIPETPSIPREVQLFVVGSNDQHPSSPNKTTSIVVPQTVQLASTKSNNNNNNNNNTTTTSTTTEFPSTSFYFGRNSCLFASSMMDGADEPSISSSIASPEVKFWRRQHSMNTTDMATAANATTTTTTPIRNSRQGPSCALLSSEGYSFEYNVKEEDDFDEDESVSLASLGTLPENYLKNPDLDYTLQELKKLEWDWLPFWKMDRLLDGSTEEEDDNDKDTVCDTRNIPLLQDQITQRLSKLDAFYRKVCKKVYKKIQPHSEEIIMANQATLDLGKNLKLAQIYLERTQRAIQRAKYGPKVTTEEPIQCESYFGVHGAIQLLQHWDVLSSQQGLVGVLQSLSDIFALEEHILQRIKAFDIYRHDSTQEYHAIQVLVRNLQELSNDAVASRIECLEPLRQRGDSILFKTLVTRLHEWLQEMAIQWSDLSRRLDANWTAYDRLVDVFGRIYDETNKNNNVDENYFARSFCTTIQTAFLLEIQKAFGRALLFPSDWKDDPNGPYARELEASRYNEKHLDAARIPNWTLNLVTIRFDFEMKDASTHPLSAVFHQLCRFLTNILLGIHGIIQWHVAKATAVENGDVGSTSSLLFGEISEELPKRRVSLWNACVQSLEGCLEEYLKYLGNKRLFSWTGDVCDDSNWFQDLVGLQDVGELASQFLSLRSQVLVGVPIEFVNDGSMIRDKIGTCCQRHVRTLHVETMNSLGGMLYRENWRMIPLDMKHDTSTNNPEDVVKSILEDISKRLFDDRGVRAKVPLRCAVNGFERTEDGYRTTCNFGNANPFDVDTSKSPIPAEKITVESIDWSDYQVALLNSMLLHSLGDRVQQKRHVMTTSLVHGIIPWCARIFVLIDKLPSIFNRAILVLTNVFDLYLTTAFRLCAGNGRNERILLGIERVSCFPEGGIDALVNSRFPSSQPFSFGRRSHQPTNDNSKLPLSPPDSVEAEMCSLVQSDQGQEEALMLRNLIINGQKNLKGIAKLDLVDRWIVDPKLDEETDEEDFASQTANVLEQRISVSFNIVCLAATLHLAAKHLSTLDKSLLDYCASVITSMPLFLQLCYRMNAMRAICGKAMVMEIAHAETVWEESKLHEHPNEYVENLCDFSALLWKCLQDSPNKLPDGILRDIWDNIVGGGFMTLIDGFSRVACCSTEGRSLMSMDAAAFSTDMGPRSMEERLGKSISVDSKFVPPVWKDPYRNLAYVDMYIKMFYFPHSDIMLWIQDSFREYHPQHLLPLILHSATNANEARKSIQTLLQLYNIQIADPRMICL